VVVLRGCGVEEEPFGAVVASMESLVRGFASV
jgi:hypothetical protein